MGDDVKKPLFEKGEEFLEIFRKGQEFSQDLLKENENLRFRVVQLEEAVKRKLAGPQNADSGDGDTFLDLTNKINKYETRLKELEERLGEAREENRDYIQRYLDVEDQNNNLANLYVASYQLHSTLDYEEVLQIILEIIINLIGAEVFAVFLLDEKSNSLKAVVSEGVETEKLPSVQMGAGVIGKCAQNRESHVHDDPEKMPDNTIEDPLVCFPLMIKDHVIGVVAIYSLLQQKKAFSPVDFELFTLLAGHAATAVFSSRLYSDSKRKLDTFQGFIDLLSQ
ncbi:MAG: GAF domain-containing protein [bacterium]